MVNAKKQIQKLIKECDLKEGDVFIDLGSHHGQEIEELIKIGVEVHSFEPHPNIAKILRQKYGDNPLVTLHEAAAWPGPSGKQLLFVEKNLNDVEDGGSTMSLVKYVNTLLRPTWDTNLYNRDPQMFYDIEVEKARQVNRAHEVATIDISEYIKNLNKPVNVLKIDVEGIEWNLLGYMFYENALKGIPAIYCEDHDGDIVDPYWSLQRGQVKKVLRENNIEIREWF